MAWSEVATGDHRLRRGLIDDAKRQIGQDLTDMEHGDLKQRFSDLHAGHTKPAEKHLFLVIPSEYSGSMNEWSLRIR